MRFLPVLFIVLSLLPLSTIALKCYNKNETEVTIAEEECDAPIAFCFNVRSTVESPSAPVKEIHVKGCDISKYCLQRPADKQEGCWPEPASEDHGNTINYDLCCCKGELCNGKELLTTPAPTTTTVATTVTTTVATTTKAAAPANPAATPTALCSLAAAMIAGRI